MTIFASFHRPPWEVRLWRSDGQVALELVAREGACTGECTSYTVEVEGKRVNQSMGSTNDGGANTDKTFFEVAFTLEGGVLKVGGCSLSV